MSARTETLPWSSVSIVEPSTLEWKFVFSLLESIDSHWGRWSSFCLFLFGVCVCGFFTSLGTAYFCISIHGRVPNSLVSPVALGELHEHPSKNGTDISMYFRDWWVVEILFGGQNCLVTSSAVWISGVFQHVSGNRCVKWVGFVHNNRTACACMDHSSQELDRQPDNSPVSCSFG